MDGGRTLTLTPLNNLSTPEVTRMNLMAGSRSIMSTVFSVVRDSIRRILAVGRKTEIKAKELTHENLKKMLHEIGRLQRFINDIEYSMDGERLDVVWRRIERSVSTYVFDVQVGGDVQHALGKPKQRLRRMTLRKYCEEVSMCSQAE